MGNTLLNLGFNFPINKYNRDILILNLNQSAGQHFKLILIL